MGLDVPNLPAFVEEFGFRQTDPDSLFDQRNEGNTDQMLFQFGILLLFPDLLPQMLGESFH